MNALHRRQRRRETTKVMSFATNFIHVYSEIHYIGPPLVQLGLGRHCLIRSFVWGYTRRISKAKCSVVKNVSSQKELNFNKSQRLQHSKACSSFFQCKRWKLYIHQKHTHTNSSGYNNVSCPSVSTRSMFDVLIVVGRANGWLHFEYVGRVLYSI